MIARVGQAGVLAAALLGSACGSSPAQPSGTEVWEFTLDLPARGAGPAPSTTASVLCDPSGACTARAWTLSTSDDGCTLALAFTVRFAGDRVQLSDFTRTPDSSCNAVPRPDAAGSGVADSRYPDARGASGQAALPLMGVLYLPGQPAPLAWSARRLQ